MKLSNFIFASLIVLFLGFSSYGQTDSTQVIDLYGKMALSFQLTSYLQLSSFDGSLLSAKKMIDDEHAWRIGVGLSGNHTEGEEINYSDYSVREDDESRLGVYVSFSKQIYLSIAEEFRGYYGIGGRIDYSHRWSTDDFYYQNEAVKFGPIAYFGIEWFVNKRISIAGEYGSYLYFSYSVYKKQIQNNNQLNDISLISRTVGFSNDGVKVGVSVYF